MGSTGLKIILGSIFSINAIAGTMGAVDTWAPVITLSGGPAWYDSNKTQSFALQPGVSKTYTANNKTHSLGTGELFWGYQRSLNTTLLGQLGLAVAASSNAKHTGDVWEDNDPEFNNFRYHYKVNHKRLAIKGKLLGQTSWWLQPYVSASAGIGFNRSHNYVIIPKIFEEIPAPGFETNTQVAFSYTIGAGLQKAITNNLQLGIGYEFADWGKHRLDLAPGQTLNHGLGANYFFTQELQFSVSYVV